MVRAWLNFMVAPEAKVRTPLPSLPVETFTSLSLGSTEVTEVP